MLFNKVKSIEEFRGIKKLSGTLKLSKLNVLIGRNNSGKTTLLQALFSFPSSTESYPPAKPKRRFLQDEMWKLRSFVYKYSGKATLTFHVNYGERSQEFRLEIDDSGTSDVFKDGTKMSEPPEIRSIAYFPYNTKFLSSLDQYLKNNEEKIVKRGVHKRVAERVSKHVGEKFTEIFLKKGGWFLRRDDASYVNIKDVGSGVRKTIRIMLTTELLDPPLILIDDFGASFHPSMTKMFLKWLSQRDSQAVIATHSMDVLYYLLDVDIKEGQMIGLKKTENDVLHHKEYTLRQLADLMDGHVDPRRLATQLKV